MLSLVTVSPVIIIFHSCCLSHHIFDQVNLWPDWVGIEADIFWQCSPGTVETQRLYPLLHGPRRAIKVGFFGLIDPIICFPYVVLHRRVRTEFVIVFNWNHFEMRLLYLSINFFYLLRTFCPHLSSFCVVSSSLRFGQISPLAFFRWGWHHQTSRNERKNSERISQEKTQLQKSYQRNKYMGCMLYSHPQHHNDTMIKQTQGQRRRKEERRKKTSLQTYSPLTLLQGFERVIQGFACERVLETEHKLYILTVTLCLSCSLRCSTRGL